MNTDSPSSGIVDCEQIPSIGYQTNNRREHHMRSPFWEIPIDENQKIKVWDVEVPAVSKVFEFYGVSLVAVSPEGKEFPVKEVRLSAPNGRIRILAVCNKKPLPLTNIKYSISYCSPEDKRKYVKSRANHIVVGRYIESFITGNLVKSNTGVIRELTTLKGFASEVLKDQNFLGTLPHWVDLNSFLETTPK